MEIYVCIGSSCHLKGSYNIINAFKELIAEYKLEDQAVSYTHLTLPTNSLV